MAAMAAVPPSVLMTLAQILRGLATTLENFARSTPMPTAPLQELGLPSGDAATSTAPSPPAPSSSTPEPPTEPDPAPDTVVHVTLKNWQHRTGKYHRMADCRGLRGANSRIINKNTQDAQRLGLLPCLVCMEDGDS